MPNRFASSVAPAALVLADGTVFHGQSIGAPGLATGEVVFHTGMTGYQEILSDPSYCRQLVTLTYPQIGNTGVNDEDMESPAMQAEALVIKTLPAVLSNWRSRQSLPEFLRAQKRPGIAGIDTRRLTRLLREKGAQSGCLVAADSDPAANGHPQKLDIEAALRAAKDFEGLAGMDLAKVVSVGKAYSWNEGSWTLGSGFRAAADADPGVHGSVEGKPSRRFKVVAYDFGVKRNILRLLADRGCDITVVPARTSAEDAMKLNPDGIFLSNGPGDPEPCDYAIAATRRFLEQKTPLFGICLGHQIMALACGARTVKMKFGHHGANHPVQDLKDGRVMITSQNHGFAVDESSLPASLRVTHRSLFDGTVQGLEHTDAPAYCFQGHPEASPGPHDIIPLFDRFIEAMGSARR